MKRSRKMGVKVHIIPESLVESAYLKIIIIINYGKHQGAEGLILWDACNSQFTSDEPLSKKNASDEHGAEPKILSSRDHSTNHALLTCSLKYIFSSTNSSSCLCSSVALRNYTVESLLMNVTVNVSWLHFLRTNYSLK